ncbi:MAG: hypothetical protein ABSH33_24280 [Steroidobacteraceae bacterium]|jgi:hypothetical protein
MAANIFTAGRVVLESPRFRFALFIDDLIAPHLLDRAVPGVRLEGPDIALSGRQILLKALT